MNDGGDCRTAPAAPGTLIISPKEKQIEEELRTNVESSVIQYYHRHSSINSFS